MNRKSPLISAPIAQLHRQFDEFRSSHLGRTKLPESLWQAAMELARQHGVYAVAHPLRLDYTRLRQRLGGVSGRMLIPQKCEGYEARADIPERRAAREELSSVVAIIPQAANRSGSVSCDPPKLKLSPESPPLLLRAEKLA